MSSFENPNVNESFWSISVTRTSSATASESRPASSRPPNPAPRITTCFMLPTLRSPRGALGSMAPMARTGDAAGALERGRDAYAARAWGDAYALLQRADELEALAPPDLGLLATAAFMLGHDEEWVAAHERAHHIHLEAGEVEPAVRCAFWIGMSLALRGELGPAQGWFGRAQRLLDERNADCVERGFLSIAHGQGLLAAGE